MPDFTPLMCLHTHPPALHPKLPPPLTGSPFGNLPLKLPKVHGLLLAPWYSHLVEESIVASKGVHNPESQPEADTSMSSVEFADMPINSAIIDDDDREKSFNSSPTFDPEIPKPAEQPSPGISKRVKGFLSSYLPTLSKSTQPQKAEKLQSS